MKRLISLTLAVGFAHAAAAQEENRGNQQDDRGPYLGFSVGSLNYEQDNPTFGIHIDDSAPAYRIIGGYRFTEHFALEGSWGETGELEERSSMFGNITLHDGEYEVLTVRALGILPLGDKVSLYGGLGYFDAELDAKVTINDFGPFDVEDGSDGPTVVVGAEFDLERFDIRTELERFEADSSSQTWEISVGVLFKF